MTMLLAVGLIAALAGAAFASFAAARAHERTAQVCREMARTWAAIEAAQRALRRGDTVSAERGLQSAANTIMASRRRRGAS